MFITDTEYPPITNKVKGNNGVTSFASQYGSVTLICLRPDGKRETIIHHEVVHLLRLFSLISQSQIMDKDIKVEPVNYYGLNLNNCHGTLIDTTPLVDGLFVLDRVLHWESTEYTDINDSCLQPLKMTGYES